MHKISTDRKQLKNFGVIMFVGFLVITSVIFLKRGYLNYSILYISCFFILAGFLAPAILKPIYIFWMKLAHLLSWFNTRLLLSVIYILLFTPIAFILKLLRKDLIDIRIDSSASSYWKKKEENEFNPADYQRQY